jgi:hypothetical protein
VLQYTLPLTSTSIPTATLPVSAEDLAVDWSGDLATWNAGEVTFFQSPITNSSTATATFAVNGGPLIFNGAGDLVLKYDPDGFYTYAPPFSSAAISQFVNNTYISNTVGAAMDAEGNLFVSLISRAGTGSFYGSVGILTPSYGGPPSTTTMLINTTYGDVALSSTQVFGVNSASQAGSIDVYDLPLTPAVSIPAFTILPGYHPVSIAVDTNGNLYVGNLLGNRIQVFTPPFSASSTASVTLPISFQVSKLAVGSGAAIPTPTPIPTATATPTAIPTPLPTRPPDQYLYVGSSPSQVLQYTLPITSTSAPTATLPISSEDFAVDWSGDLVTVNAGELMLFPAPITSSSTATATFAIGGGPLLFNSAGDLVLTSGSPAGFYVYSPPFSSSTTASQFISNANVGDSAAMDTAGNIFASFGVLTRASGVGGYVGVFAPPYTGTPIVTPMLYNTTYGGIALSSTQLFVFDSNSEAGSIDVYDLPLTPTSVPAFTILPGYQPVSIAVDTSGNLYVGNFLGNRIQVFTPPFSASSTPSVTLPINFMVSKLAVGN